MSIIIDGMDQNKSKLPHFERRLEAEPLVIRSSFDGSLKFTFAVLSFDNLLDTSTMLNFLK